MGRFINQEANFAADFGIAYRSSAIFYKPKNVRTTISFSNYWDFKNNLKVGLLASVRDMKGKLVFRKELSFGESNVINYVVSEVDEGSVEIEAFSSSNLRIPYAAIMAVYETDKGVSMVHSYGRNHSLIELEEDRVVVEARESCWTLRAQGNITNKAIFHNGHVELDSQEATFIVTRDDGLEKTVFFQIPPVDRFETVVFEAEKIFPGLSDFLSGHGGWGTLHFNSKSSFTRLLLVWENAVKQDIQVTHSNFDYSSHTTNKVMTSKPAYMSLPVVYGKLPDVIVYPKYSDGTYNLQSDIPLSGGTVLDNVHKNLVFTRTDGTLPARIVTALSSKVSPDDTMPFECSLGIVHEGRPQKRFHWFLISSEMQSVIHFTAYSEIYPVGESIDLVFRLYSSVTKEIAEYTVSYPSLNDLPNEIDVADIFDLKNVDRFGYVSVFSHYGGLYLYSSLRKGNVVTLEHSF